MPITYESFIVFLVSVLSLLLKDSNYIGIFYCFFSFGTIHSLLFFFSRTRDWNHESPKPHHIQPPNSTHIWTLIRQCAVRRFGVDPDYRSGSRAKSMFSDLPRYLKKKKKKKKNHQIFNCNISKRSSGQELPFILFELRALTCL